MARREQPDHYALLQVSPQAGADELTAAYTRLQELYRPEHTAEAAPELQEIAAGKRMGLERAYAVLSDPERRAAYDRQQGFGAGAAPTLDYAPLPPARGKEREVVAPQLERAAPGRRVVRRTGPAAWLLPLAASLAVLALLVIVLLSGVRTTDGRAALATPTISGITLPSTDAQIEQLWAAAASAKTADAWSAYGNALFDNLQTLREQAPQSPQYRGLLPLWLDVADAYAQAVALADSATLRADRAVALFNYGQDAADPERVAEAVAEVQRGIDADVREPRALLNYGLILSQVRPARQSEAFALWRKVRDSAPESQEAQFATRLLQSYGQS